MIVQSLLRIRLIVVDLDRTRQFYETALGFTAGPVFALEAGATRLLQVARARAVRLRLGNQEMELVETQPAGAPYPTGSTSADLWFQHFAIVTNDIAQAYAQLSGARLSGHAFTAVSEAGPQRLPAASGGVIAFKFRDPDGHPLELIQFPGDQRPAGIDHSAISVASAERSIAFYTGLGLTLGPRQLNAGPEQDRLDGLAQARVDVVALRPAVTPAPHLELLGYRHPVGRPLDRGPVDIAATQLVLAVDRLADGAGETMLRDPDGHRLLLVG